MGLVGQAVVGDDVWMASRAPRWIEDSRGGTIAVLDLCQWRMRIAW
jgi:hypothetical protein